MLPTRYTTPTNPTNDRNISPVEGYIFSQLRSMQNVQTLRHSPGTNKYICKYIGNMDNNNYTIVSTDDDKHGKLRTDTSFLYNTKVTLSNHHAKKVTEKDMTRNHPKERRISLMEMIQMIFTIF